MIIKNGTVLNHDFKFVDTDAVKMATNNPAETVGIFDKVGSIKEGKVADLVLIDKETLEVKNVVLRGKLLV